MYLAKVNQKFKGVFYYYKNNTIYIDVSKKNFEVDEYIIHECIHYFQNFSKITKKNNRAGLCEFTEFRIIGLGINEAIVQYFTEKALGEEIHRVSNGKIAIYTNSENNYKYITSLAGQILYLLGETEAIDSAINTNKKFETILYNAFEETTDKILKNFDNILNENNSENRDENKIIKMYMQTQELIYTTYFKKACKYLTTTKEVDEKVDKLENYDKMLAVLTGDDTYYNNFWQFKKNISSVFFKKYLEINRQKNKNSLLLISKNPIYSLWRKIVNFINGNHQSSND